MFSAFSVPVLIFNRTPAAFTFSFSTKQREYKCIEYYIIRYTFKDGSTSPVMRPHGINLLTKYRVPDVKHYTYLPTNVSCDSSPICKNAIVIQCIRTYRYYESKIAVS